MNKIVSIVKSEDGTFDIERDGERCESLSEGKTFDVIDFMQRQSEDFRNQDVVQVNFLMANVQASALAHGITAALIAAKNAWSIDSFEFKAFEQVCQSRIGQCVAAMLHNGLDMDEINHRIKQGH